MSSEDVIELGSSDDEAEPAPKKKKPMPDAMVVIPNKLPGLTIKPAQPNQYRKQKGVLSKPIIVNKSICNINSNVNRKKTVGGPLQLPYNTNTKVVKTVIPAQNKVYNPLSVSKNLIGPRLLLPKPQIKGLKNQTEAKGSKLINNLPPGITIKLIQNATEVNKKKIRSSQNPGEVLTVDIDDEEMSATSTSSPQWYIRPEDQVEEKKEHITENSEHEVQLSMEEQNNKEPENSRYVEITIEDSPLKPLPQKNGTNKDTAIIIEDSPAKVITQNSQKVESDCESNDRNEPQSKKRLDYPKENNYERQVVEIEIDLMDSGEQSHIKRIDNKELQKCKDKDKEYTEFGNKIHAKSNVEVTVQTKESVDASNSEFHPVYQDFIDVCFKLENSDDMKKIVDKKIKAYYKQCPKEYVESEDFIDLVSSKIVSMKMGPEKMYLYIKDIVDELNLQRKMAKSTIVSSKEDIQQDTIKTSATHKECEYDNKKRKQIRKLEKTIKKLHRAIQKLEEQEIDFDDEQDSVYLLTERYKERMVRVHQKFCQLTNTKMPSEPRIHIESRPGRPTGPAKRLEKWINKKVTIGSPLPFPDFHDVLRCVRDANEEDRLGWNECDVMDEARDLFTRCGKKLQRRRQENEWRLAASRITQDKDPAEENIDLRKRLDDNKILSSEKEGELLKKYVDKQNQLNLEAVEIGDKEAEESPLESDEEEEEEEIESKDSVEDKQKRKEKLTKLLQEKSEPTRDKKNDLKPIKETEEGIEDKVDDQEQKLIDDKSDDKHTTEPNLEVHTENLETEEVVKSTESVKESTDKKDQVKTGNESDSDKVSSDVDELLLYQKSRKCHDHELNISSNESSDSESPNVISDILKSESEGEMDKILSDDVISIEDSSYSESETTYDRITTNYSKNVDNLVNSNFEIEYSSTTFVTEEPTVQQDNVDEDVLLASSDEEANKDEDAEIGDTCINLKDDNISISETTVDGENLEQDSIRNNERSDTPDNNNQLKMVLENCTNSEDTMIQEYSEDENEVLKNKTIEGTDSNDSPKEVVDMECISDGNSDENASVDFTGFTMPKRNPSNVSLHAVPPPPSQMNAVPPSNPGLSKQGYSTMNAITQNAIGGTWGTLGKKRAKTEDEYFDEDDEPPTPALAYIPAPGSPTNEASSSRADEEEEDPLDAYMAGLEKQAAKDMKVSKENAVSGKGDAGRGTRGDIDEMDDEESYYKYMEENPLQTADEGSDVEVEYDEDGNPIAPPKKKFIDPLPPIDHSEIQYEPFEKNFYTPHEDIEKLDQHQVEELKKNLGVKISGPDPPKPVSSFAHLGFDEQLMRAIRKSEYSQPTPVQAAGVPAALSGRDIIGIARTGSGKTAAFLWPLLVHIMDQRELAPGDGPIGLILAPTRELAQQIYMEVKKFGKVYNIRCVCCYGGGSKWEQSKALEGGAEIVVGTPGRIIDMVKCKATSLQRVTYLVLDEADRMFDMGFEPQVRSICSHVRPERQALLFSATFPRRVERLARDALHDPVRVQHGAAGEACRLVKQRVTIFNKPEEKWPWLLENLVDFLSSGSVLIFVTKKLEAEQTAANLGVQQYDALLLHGDMEQADRNKVITAFKRQETNILVATDVAARGLDIPHIRTVVNYTVARDVDTHTHRVGRTGRAGVPGTAHTLLSRDRDKDFAGHLLRNLEGVQQEVPEELMQLAMQSAWFRKSRFKKGKGKNLNIGGCGLGYKERPGLPSYNDEMSLTAAVEKTVEKAGGPATDRLASLKQAFRSQYNQFTASSDHSWEQTRPVLQPGVNAPANIDKTERVRKSGKRSRWE